jgi:flagellar export protein FliJ
MAPKFSLQSVLDFRHSRVEALEMEYSKLLEAQQEGLLMQEQNREALKDLYALLRQEQSGDMDLITVQHLRRDTRSVSERLEQIGQALVVLAGRIEAKRYEIVAARQAEETLTTLKDKEITRWQAEKVRVENRQQDDTYISRAFRNDNRSANV